MFRRGHGESLASSGDYLSTNAAGIEPPNPSLHRLKVSMLRRLSPLLLLGFVQLGCYATILSLGDLGNNISAFVPLFFLCFLFYILSILFAERRFSGISASPSVLLLIVALFSVAFRLTMISLKPSLSHDIMRFFWDGRLLNHGFNPYLYRPDSAELDALKDVPYFWDYEFKNTFTVYPPLAQLLFGGAYLFAGGNPLGIKVAVAALDLLNILLLAALLFRLGGDIAPSGLVLYAWSPLSIVESAGNGHIEPLPVFFLLLSLWLISRQRFRLSSLSYSLACWSKLFPILLLPVYLKCLRESGRRCLNEFLLYFALSSVLFLSPVFMTSGVNLLYQVVWYSQNITYNPSIFMIVEDMFARLRVTSTLTSLIVYAAFLVVVVASLRLRSTWSLSRLIDNSILVLGTYLLLAPAVFQWYVLWLLPFLALKGLNRNTVGWLFFSAAVVLPYLPQFSIDYDIHMIALLEYAPLYILLLVSAVPAAKCFIKARTSAWI